MQTCCRLLLASLAILPLPAQQPAPPAASDALGKLLQQYDKDRDGKVQRTEYPRAEAAWKNLDRNADGVVDGADFAAAILRTRRPVQPRPKAAELAKLPKVGDVAPDFELPMLGMKDTKVKLSSFRGDRPVALVFGSYT